MVDSTIEYSNPYFSPFSRKNSDMINYYSVTHAQIRFSLILINDFQNDFRYKYLHFRNSTKNIIFLRNVNNFTVCLIEGRGNSSGQAEVEFIIHIIISRRATREC